MAQLRVVEKINQWKTTIGYDFLCEYLGSKQAFIVRLQM